MFRYSDWYTRTYSFVVEILTRNIIVVSYNSDEFITNRSATTLFFGGVRRKKNDRRWNFRYILSKVSRPKMPETIDFVICEQITIRNNFVGWASRIPTMYVHYFEATWRRNIRFFCCVIYIIALAKIILVFYFSNFFPQVNNVSENFEKFKFSDFNYNVAGFRV